MIAVKQSDLTPAQRVHIRRVAWVVMRGVFARIDMIFNRNPGAQQ